MSNFKTKSLLAVLSDVPLENKRGKCGVVVLLSSLSEDEQQMLNTRLTDIQVHRELHPNKANPASALWLSKVLTANGYPITDRVINHHVRGMCSCR